MSGLEFWKRTGLVVAAATVVNVAVYLIATAVGVNILVPMGASPVPLPAGLVVVFTIVPLVLAAVFLLLVRRAGLTNPRVFAGIVVVVAALSLLAPLAADLTAPNKLVLAAMHVVAALAALLGLAPLSRSVERTPAAVPVGTA